MGGKSWLSDLSFIASITYPLFLKAYKNVDDVENWNSMCQHVYEKQNQQSEVLLGRDQKNAHV